MQNPKSQNNKVIGIAINKKKNVWLGYGLNLSLWWKIKSKPMQ